MLLLLKCNGCATYRFMLRIPLIYIHVAMQSSSGETRREMSRIEQSLVLPRKFPVTQDILMANYAEGLENETVVVINPEKVINC